MFIKLTLITDAGEEPSLINVDEIKRITIDATSKKTVIIWKATAKDGGNYYDDIKEGIKEAAEAFTTATLYKPVIKV